MVAALPEPTLAAAPPGQDMHKHAMRCRPAGRSSITKEGDHSKPACCHTLGAHGRPAVGGSTPKLTAMNQGPAHLFSQALALSPGLSTTPPPLTPRSVYARPAALRLPLRRPLPPAPLAPSSSPSSSPSCSAAASRAVAP